jgi:two-component system, sensor histidine kinase LadS
MKSFARALFTSAFLLFAAAISAQAFTPGRVSWIASDLKVYEDAQGKAGADEVLRMYRAGALAPLGHRSLSPGYTTSTYWLVLPLPEGSEGKRLYLFTTDAGLYRLEGFVPLPGGSFDRSSGSFAEPYALRQAPIINPALAFVVPEGLPPESRVIVFSVRTDSGLHTSFLLADEVGLFKYKVQRSVLLASIFAVLLSLFAFNAFALVFSGGRRHFYYVLYLGTYILYLFDLQGVDFQFLFPGLSGEWTKAISPLLGSLSLVLSALFAKAFLGIDRRSKILRPCLYALAALGASLGLVSLTGLRYDYVSRFGNNLASFFVVAAILVTIIRIFQGYKPAVFFLIANAGVVAGVLAHGLGENGHLPDSLIVSNASLLGQALQLILFSASLTYEQSIERRERIAAQELLQSQEAAFRKFVPLEFLEFLGKREISEVVLGEHVEEEMTVMFADIRSFTALSEVMAPDENFEFINDYLRRIVPTVKDYGGFIDKFMGDSIMALFPNQADDALRAGIEMQQAITDYNEEREAKGETPIRVGVGLHTGSLMLGIIGDEERLESTVISDAVNLASRVEKLNKFFGSSILITESTFKSIQNPLGFQYRFLGKVKVKGKSAPAAIFEVFGGETEELRSRKLSTQRDFEQGLVAYLLRDFRQARAHFAEVLRANREDKAAVYYYLHAKRAMEVKPGDDWDGTIESTGA